MTGGRVVVLGSTGRNFAAGMSGGIAYVLDPDRSFVERCNLEMVLLESIEDAAELEEVRSLIERHVEYTGSQAGQRVLQDWNQQSQDFVRVIPKDYKRMTEQIQKVHDTGLTGEAALLAAFEANMRELTRSGA